MILILALLIFISSALAATPTTDKVCQTVSDVYPFELVDLTHWREMCQSDTLTAEELLYELRDPLAQVSINAPEVSAVFYRKVGTSTTGYIRFDGFVGGAELIHNFELAIEEARYDDGIILDLRGSGGGEVETAFKVLGRLTQAKLGGIRLRTRLQDALDEKTLTVEPYGSWQFRGPVIILVDSYSHWPCQAIVHVSKQRSLWETVGYRLPPVRGVEAVSFQLPGDRYLELPTALALTLQHEPLTDRIFEPGVDLNDETTRRGRRGYSGDEALERGLDELYRMQGRIHWLNDELKKQQNETKIRRREKR